jgi:hypothetical protein
MGIFSDSVEASFEWTKTLLLRPFNFKKWLVLSFIAMLAGSMAGGSRLNFPSGSTPQKPAVTSTQNSKAIAPAPAPSPTQIMSKFKSQIKTYLPFIIAGIILFILLSIFFIWLYSRFIFIFIDSIIKNDASIKLPFKNFRVIGSSLFSFQLVFTLVSTSLVVAIVAACLGHLRGMGVFTHPQSVGGWKILFACLGYLLLFLPLGIVSGLISFVVNNFVVPVMYKDSCGFIAGWHKAISFLGVNKGLAAGFFFLKVALYLVCSIIYGIVSLVVMLGLIIPGALIAGGGYGLYHILPGGSQVFLLVIGLGIGIPVLLALGYLVMCMYLPCAVFLRTFNLKFLARLDARYDLFTPGGVL